MRPVVIGLGNPLRGDDGVGPRVAELLAADPPDADVVVLDGESTRLLEAWHDRPRVLVIDAVVTGAAPGTVHEVEVGADPLPGWGPGPSSHAAGVAEAVALGRALDRLPDELLVVGIEPGDVSHGAELSPAVEAALPEVVRRVRERVAR